MATKKDVVKTSEAMFAPVRALNELAVAHVSRVLDMQLGFARKYADLGLASFKAAAAVSDVEGVRSYFADQSDVVRKTGETVMADAKALGQLNVDYVVEAQKIVKEGFGKLPKLAA